MRKLLKSKEQEHIYAIARHRGYVTWQDIFSVYATKAAAQEMLRYFFNNQILKGGKGDSFTFIHKKRTHTVIYGGSARQDRSSCQIQGKTWNGKKRPEYIINVQKTPQHN